MQLRLTILLLLIVTNSRGQESDFDLKNLKFKGLGFITKKEIIIKAFGQGKKIETNYECGGFTNDQDHGPYYQLVYTDFSYIGSDKEEFSLENVNFDVNGNIKMYYKNIVLSGRTTESDFIKIFGEKLRDNLVKHSDHDTFLLPSVETDDGAVFSFRNGLLYKFEYWTPC